MSAITAIAAINGSADVSTITNTIPGGTPAQQAAPEVSFGDMLANGLNKVEAKVDVANAKVREFAINEDMPVHEVTIALEEARLSVELALQVRSRLVEGYRELMNMQL